MSDQAVDLLAQQELVAKPQSERNRRELLLPLLTGRTQTHAGDFAPAPPITLAEVKAEVQALIRTRDAAAVRSGLTNLLRRLP